IRSDPGHDPVHRRDRRRGAAGRRGALVPAVVPGRRRPGTHPDPRASRARRVRASGRRPLLAATLGLVLGAAAGARANIQIDITAESNTGPTVALRLTVANSGTEPAHDVTPSVTALGEQQSGQLMPMLEPGAAHIWELTLPAPREPGDFPMVIRV